MRIDEIASAEDQIALFKLITDKVWQALGDQQRAEAETKAAQPLKAKLAKKNNTGMAGTKRVAFSKPNNTQQQNPIFIPAQNPIRPREFNQGKIPAPAATKIMSRENPAIGSKTHETDDFRSINKSTT
jgi:hypothetical protein